jgi:hypothetical protein
MKARELTKWTGVQALAHFLLACTYVCIFFALLVTLYWVTGAIH